MKTAEELLLKLGMTSCTERHLRVINEFIANKEKNEEKDCKKLLNRLGTWDDDDLIICKHWAREQK